MAKKVIQVPVDEELLEELDYLSRKQRRARSELIRQACRIYLRQPDRKKWTKPTGRDIREYRRKRNWVKLR